MNSKPVNTRAAAAAAAAAHSPINMSLYDTATILSDEFLYEFEKHAVRGVEKTACLEKNILGHGRCRRASYSVQSASNYLVFRGPTVNAFNHTFIPESAEIVAHYEPNGVSPGKFTWLNSSSEVARIRQMLSLGEYQQQSVMVRQKDAYRLMIVMAGVLQADGMYFHRIDPNKFAVYLIRDERLPEVKKYESGNILQFTDRSYRQLITKFAVNPRHVMIEYFDTVRQLQKQKSLDDDGNVIGLKVIDDQGASIAYTFNRNGGLIGTVFDGIDPVPDAAADVDDEYDTNYESDDAESIWSIDVAGETFPEQDDEEDGEDISELDLSPPPSPAVLPSEPPTENTPDLALRPEISVQEEIVAATPLIPPYDSQLEPVMKSDIVPTPRDLSHNAVVPPNFDPSFTGSSSHPTGETNSGGEAGHDDESEKRPYSDDAGAPNRDVNHEHPEDGIINTLKNMWPFSKAKQNKPKMHEAEQQNAENDHLLGNPADSRNDPSQLTNDLPQKNIASINESGPARPMIPKRSDGHETSAGKPGSLPTPSLPSKPEHEPQVDRQIPDTDSQSSPVRPRDDAVRRSNELPPYPADAVEPSTPSAVGSSPDGSDHISSHPAVPRQQNPSQIDSKPSQWPSLEDDAGASWDYPRSALDSDYSQPGSSPHPMSSIPEYDQAEDIPISSFNPDPLPHHSKRGSDNRGRRATPFPLPRLGHVDPTEEPKASPIPALPEHDNDHDSVTSTSVDEDDAVSEDRKESKPKSWWNRLFGAKQEAEQDCTDVDQPASASDDDNDDAGDQHERHRPAERMKPYNPAQSANSVNPSNHLSDSPMPSSHGTPTTTSPVDLSIHRSNNDSELSPGDVSGPDHVNHTDDKSNRSPDHYSGRSPAINPFTSRAVNADYRSASPDSASESTPNVDNNELADSDSLRPTDVIPYSVSEPATEIRHGQPPAPHPSAENGHGMQPVRPLRHDQLQDLDDEHGSNSQQQRPEQKSNPGVSPVPTGSAADDVQPNRCPSIEPDSGADRSRYPHSRELPPIPSNTNMAQQENIPERARWPKIPTDSESTSCWDYPRSAPKKLSNLNGDRRSRLSEINARRPSSNGWPKVDPEADDGIPGWHYPRTSLERPSLSKIDERRPSHFESDEPDLPSDAFLHPQRHPEHDASWPAPKASTYPPSLSDISAHSAHNHSRPDSTKSSSPESFLPSRHHDSHPASAKANSDRKDHTGKKASLVSDGHSADRPLDPASTSPIPNASPSTGKPEHFNATKSRPSLCSLADYVENDIDAEADGIRSSDPESTPFWSRLFGPKTPRAQETRPNDKVKRAVDGQAPVPANVETAMLTGNSHAPDQRVAPTDTVMPRVSPSSSLKENHLQPESFPVDDSKRLKNLPEDAPRDLKQPSSSDNARLRPADQSSTLQKSIKSNPGEMAPARRNREVPNDRIFFDNVLNHSESAPLKGNDVSKTEPVEKAKYLSKVPKNSSKAKHPSSSDSAELSQPVETSECSPKGSTTSKPANSGSIKNVLRLPSNHGSSGDVIDKKPDTFLEDPRQGHKILMHRDDDKMSKTIVDPDLASDSASLSQHEEADMFRVEPSSDSDNRIDSMVSDGTLRKRSKNHPNLSSLFLEALERAERADNENMDSMRGERDPLQSSSDEIDHNMEATSLERLALCCSWLCGNPTQETQH